MSPTLTQQAHAYIYKKLARGELRPGARLSNRKIAKETGMSLIPVREAISRLASEGLVEHHPKLGAFVAQPNRQELAELYDLREALECHAAATVTGKIRGADLAEMARHNDELRQILAQMADAGVDAMDVELNDRWVIADVAFHMTMLRASGNRRIIKTVSNLRVMATIFSYSRQTRTRQRLEGTCDEHDRIIIALRDGTPDDARGAMAEHIRHGCQAALIAFDRQRADDAIGGAERSSLHEHLRELEEG